MHIVVRMEGENGHACTWHSCSLENNSFMFNNTLIILLSQDNKARFLKKLPTCDNEIAALKEIMESATVTGFSDSWAQRTKR